MSVSLIIAQFSLYYLINYNKNEFNKIKKEILNILSKLGINPINIIPISALLGENISKKPDNIKWYNGSTLTDSLDNIKLIKNKLRQLRLETE